MLAAQSIRWLIDTDLPQIEGERPDTLPITHCGRDIFTEALREGRWVASGTRSLLEPYSLPINCPTIVVVSGGLCTEEGLRRNLLHLEFCLLHERRDQSKEGQQFLIDLDRAIYRVKPEGGMEKIETWKVPTVKAVLAWSASA